MNGLTDGRQTHWSDGTTDEHWPAPIPEDTVTDAIVKHGANPGMLRRVRALVPGIPWGLTLSSSGRATVHLPVADRYAPTQNLRRLRALATVAQVRLPPELPPAEAWGLVFAQSGLVAVTVRHGACIQAFAATAGPLVPCAHTQAHTPRPAWVQRHGIERRDAQDNLLAVVVDQPAVSG